MTEHSVDKLIFSEQRIFDNIHGFIRLTEFEWQLVDSPIFQRLRNIRQLGLLDYVFPGALHNRFNHSLGVMHIADQMVVSLQEKGKLNGSREIVRIAALLHDVGHYPWSHIIETAVIRDAEKKVPKSVEQIKVEVTGSNNHTTTYTNLGASASHQANLELYPLRNSSSDFAHHERIAGIVLFKSNLYPILKSKFSDAEIFKIAQIIAGEYAGPEKLIIHSELDADRFDYLLRDSSQTGVTYGFFDLNQIIRNIDLYPSNQKEGSTGLVVNKKGQKAVEHYLLARYFLYSTVIYQKTTAGFHIMADNIYKGLLERGLVLNYSDLVDIFDTKKESDYLDYDDSYIFEKLKKIDSGKIEIVSIDEQQVSPDFLKDLVKKVLYRDPLKRVWEKQMLLRSGQDKPYELIKYSIPTTVDFIVDATKIPKEWYIQSHLKNAVTGLSPAKLIRDGDSEDDFIEHRIKIFNGKDAPESLTKEKSSILQYLQNTELHIYGVYTKDQEYSDRIKFAMRECDVRFAKAEK